MKNNKSTMCTLTIATLLLMIITTSVFAATKYYHGTTMIYSNSITDGSTGWNGSVSISTSPTTYMDSIGATVWTTYQYCDGTIDYLTFYQLLSTENSWMIQNHASQWFDGIARLKAPCGGDTEGYNYANYYWQDGVYSADAGSDVARQIISSVW